MNARTRSTARISRLARAEAPVLRRATPVEAMARTPDEAAVAVAAKRAAWAASIPAETLDLLRAGKLEQACPDCGRWEAAGSYCSGCDRRMGPDDWYSNGNLARRAVAHQRAAEKAQTRVKRPPGRPRAELDSPPPAVSVSAYSPDAGFWPA